MSSASLPAALASGQQPLAVALLSGGLDSATLSFRYGQRHDIELARAAEIAATAGCEHVVVDLDLAAFGGSALTDPSIAVPKHDDVTEVDESIPVTYVPARNTVMLSIALSLAEVRGISDVYIGVNAVDYSGYPDCRPEFVAAFEAMANLATRAAVEGLRFTVHTPLLDLSKAQIVQLAVDLGVDLSRTVSCYDPSPEGRACGRCDACLLRARGFAEAGVVDPAGTA